MSEYDKHSTLADVYKAIEKLRPTAEQMNEAAHLYFDKQKTSMAHYCGYHLALGDVTRAVGELRESYEAQEDGGSLD
jgi:hypothetical protein